LNIDKGKLKLEIMTLTWNFRHQRPRSLKVQNSNCVFRESYDGRGGGRGRIEAKIKVITVNIPSFRGKHEKLNVKSGKIKKFQIALRKKKERRWSELRNGCVFYFQFNSNCLQNVMGFLRDEMAGGVLFACFLVGLAVGFSFLCLEAK
jgi:hypothetical protein